MNRSKFSLVEIIGGRPMTSSLKLAKSLGVPHKAAIHIVEDVLIQLKRDGMSAFANENFSHGDALSEDGSTEFAYYLSRDAFALFSARLNESSLEDVTALASSLASFAKKETQNDQPTLH